MLILTAETDKIQAVLAGNVAANQLQCMSNWRDITTTAYTPGRTVINTNQTTDIDLVGSPGASTQRVVDFLSIYNTDTANATVTIKFDANGTEYILFKATISTGEKIEYQDGQGFRVIANSGAVKTSLNQGNNTVGTSLTAVVLGSDQVNNNATLNTIADVTGLSFAVVSENTYYFKFIIWYTAAATTTGSRWSISGPANTLLAYKASYGLSAAGTSGTDVITDNNGAAYDTPAASNATSPTATAGQANIATIEGFIKPSADGSVIARFASEIANSAITAKAGSVVYYQQVL